MFSRTTHLAVPSSECVQGPKNVIHEDEIAQDPGIVERCCESKFVPIQWTQVVGDVNEEPVCLGVD